ALTIALPAVAVRSVGALTQRIGRLRGQVPALTLDKARGSLASGWWCDDATARAQLGWSEAFPLEGGLEDTVRWLRDRGLPPCASTPQPTPRQRRAGGGESS